MLFGKKRVSHKNAPISKDSAHVSSQDWEYAHIAVRPHAHHERLKRNSLSCIKGVVMAKKKYCGRYPIVSNIKFRFTIQCESMSALVTLLKERFNARTYGNFAVLRIVRTTYTVYSNKCVNVTGVRNFSLMQEAVQLFCSAIGISQEHDTSPTIIDNLTANGHFQQRVSLFELCQTINANPQRSFQPTFNPNYFPGAILRSGQGTITVFGTGSYVVVGCKTRDKIETLVECAYALIKRDV